MHVFEHQHPGIDQGRHGQRVVHGAAGESIRAFHRSGVKIQHLRRGARHARPQHPQLLAAWGRGDDLLGDV